MDDVILRHEEIRGIHHLVMDNGPNALDRPMMEALHSALRNLAADGAPAVILASAHPTLFCPGWDLKILAEAGRKDVVPLVERALTDGDAGVRTGAIRTLARLRGEKAAELMRFVGLTDYIGAEADSMPYGALKRLEIARALAAEPRLLLLDEPAAGLNPAETAEIDALIQKVGETGVTVVLVEHDMKLVMGVSAHILVIDNGHLLAQGTGAEIRDNPDVVAAYLGEEGRNL